MKFKILFPLMLAIGILSCKTSSNNNVTPDCSATPITVEAYSSLSGNITITSPLGTSYTYSVDGSVFQASPLFGSLTGITHTVVAKNENGCTGTITVSITGCGAAGSSGTDTGSHGIFAGALALPLNKIHDSLVYVVSGSSITIHSASLGRILTAAQDVADCNIFKLDSVIFASGDTLRIATTLPIPGGFVKIWGLRAGGTATFSSTGASTVINISNGHTNITNPIDLSNITPGLALNIKGSFTKFP